MGNRTMKYFPINKTVSLNLKLSLLVLISNKILLTFDQREGNSSQHNFIITRAGQRLVESCPDNLNGVPFFGNKHSDKT